MSEVTVVITACGRPDLLKITIESFLKYNTYEISQWIITEDSGIPNINKELEETYPHFMWIKNEERIGQIKSIDKAYSFVKTPYIFHLEDDWETYSSGCIEESLKILDSNETISAVMCREHGQGGYKVSDNPPFLSCWGEWGHYSFNPGLRRLSNYKTLFNSSYSSFIECNITEGLKGEIAINKFYKEKGFRMAMTSDPSGYLRHIGDNRHIGNISIPPLMNPKIGLCMIVKDEAHIIKEVLQCTLPLIDTYCIVDTGSTDNTIETIQNFYKEHNIEGHIFEREWKDFGTNRSQALALCDGKMDYIFVMDADDLITFPENGRKILNESLKYTPNAVELTMVQGALNYTRLLIYKANDGWKYKGVLHEYPANDKSNNRIFKLSNFMVESRRLGARTMKDPTNKMKRDIATLLKGVEDEPDNERYMFYLAQSYRDDGQIDKAVEWYKKRFEIGRWYEESYISAYNIAKLTNSKEWAWKAHEHNPKRIECLFSYISWCRANSIFSQELFAMAQYAATVPKPVDQHLFVETDVYDWKIFDELSIIAFYTGHHDISLKMSDKLLAEEKFPEHQRYRITFNRGYAINKKNCVLDTNIETLQKKQYWDSILQRIRQPSLEKTVWELPSNAKLSLTIVEPRSINDLKCILWNMAHVYGGTNTALYIFHGTKNETFVKEVCKDWTNVQFIQLGIQNLTWKDYSYKLTTTEFWKSIETQFTLIMQNDSLLFRKIPEKFFQYDFVGAPLKDGNPNIFFQNGGFSLRNVERMVEITTEAKPEYPLNSNGEDIYFACRIPKEKKPSFLDSTEFSVEFYFRKNPVGCHKPWPYNSIENLKCILDNTPGV